MPPTNKPQSAIERVNSVLTSPAMLAQIQRVCRTSIKPDTVARLVLNTIRRTPKLAQCSQESLLGAVMEATSLGLEIGASQQAHLVPFKGQATLIIGYQGFRELAYRSDKIASLHTGAVYEGDRYSVQLGDTPTITHEQCPPDDRGELVGCYAVAHLTTGGKLMDWMWRKEIDGIRARAKAGRDGPWVTDFEMMARKTVFRRLAKMLPQSHELSQAIAIDESAEAGTSQPFTVSGIEVIDPEPQEPTPAAETTETPAEAPEPPKATDTPPGNATLVTALETATAAKRAAVLKQFSIPGTAWKSEVAALGREAATDMMMALKDA